MKIICTLDNHQININDKAEPVFYLKPETALLLRNRPFYFPEYSGNIHCKPNLVFKICKVGKYIQQKFAKNYYNEIAICLNFFAVDLLDICRENKLPWELATSFDNSLPISNFISIESLNNFNSLNLTLKINDTTIHDLQLSDISNEIDKTISYVSQYIMIKTGDLFVLGNEMKSCPIAIDMQIQAIMNDVLSLNCKIK